MYVANVSLCAYVYMCVFHIGPEVDVQCLPHWLSSFLLGTGGDMTDVMGMLPMLAVHIAAGFPRLPWRHGLCRSRMFPLLSVPPCTLLSCPFPIQVPSSLLISVVLTEVGIF